MITKWWFHRKFFPAHVLASFAWASRYFSFPCHSSRGHSAFLPWQTSHLPMAPLWAPPDDPDWTMSSQLGHSSFLVITVILGFHHGSDGKESACMQETWVGKTWVGKMPWRRERLPTPVFWPGEFHGLHGFAKSQTWLNDFQSLLFLTWENHLVRLWSISQAETAALGGHHSQDAAFWETESCAGAWRGVSLDLRPCWQFLFTVVCW